MPTRFDRDTAVRPAGDGLLDAAIDPGWFIVRGPNGGYVAALMLRALLHAVDDPSRAPRSLTVHFTAPPRPRRPALLGRRTGADGKAIAYDRKSSGMCLEGIAVVYSSRLLFPAPRSDRRPPMMNRDLD